MCHSSLNWNLQFIIMLEFTKGFIILGQVYFYGISAATE